MEDICRVLKVNETEDTDRATACDSWDSDTQPYRILSMLGQHLHVILAPWDYGGLRRSLCGSKSSSICKPKHTSIKDWRPLVWILNSSILGFMSWPWLYQFNFKGISPWTLQTPWRAVNDKTFDSSKDLVDHVTQQLGIRSRHLWRRRKSQVCWR